MAITVVLEQVMRWSQHWHNSINMKCHGLGSDVSKVRDALKKKHPVVALMGPGYFTKKGHFIVLVAIDDNDQVTVADVGSRQRTQYKYPLKEVIAPDEVSISRRSMLGDLF